MSSIWVDFDYDLIIKSKKPAVDWSQTYNFLTFHAVSSLSWGNCEEYSFNFNIKRTVKLLLWLMKFFSFFFIEIYFQYSHLFFCFIFIHDLIIQRITLLNWKCVQIILKRNRITLNLGFPLQLKPQILL